MASLFHRIAPIFALFAIASCNPAPVREDQVPWGTTAEAVTACAGPSTVQGIDVSGYQGNINWGAVAASGKAFAIMKATEGTGFVDSTFAQNWSRSRAAGVIRGAYHFFHPSVDPAAQANRFADVMGPLLEGDLPPMLDLEVSDGLGAAAVANATRIFLDTLQSRTGRKPMIYTGYYFWRDQVGDPPGFSSYPLVMAAYVSGCPQVPTQWGRFTMWQYSDAGNVSGIAGGVDLDEFNGTLADLRALAASSTPFAAQFVAQSFPYASMPPVQIHEGESTDAWIELKNVGTHAWDSNTRLGTTMPRDRSSPLAASTWLAPNRPAGVTGTVPPGGTFRFTFTIHGPNMPGRFDEHFGVVQEGTAWFSDQGQGGPPDDQLEGIWQVEPGPPPPPSPDAGHSEDAGHMGGGADGGTGAPDGRVVTPPQPGEDAGIAGSVPSGSGQPEPGAPMQTDPGLHTVHTKGCTCAGTAGRGSALGLVLLVGLGLYPITRKR